MAKEIATLNFSRKKGKFYYVNSDGNLVERDQKTKEKVVVATPHIKKLKGHFYFLNKKGNIEMSRMKNQKI
jgi:hypothetical protein